jgi:hypothetical protein
MMRGMAKAAATALGPGAPGHRRVSPRRLRRHAPRAARDERRAAIPVTWRSRCRGGPT